MNRSKDTKKLNSGSDDCGLEWIIIVYLVLSVASIFLILGKAIEKVFYFEGVVLGHMRDQVHVDHSLSQLLRGKHIRHLLQKQKENFSVMK